MITKKQNMHKIKNAACELLTLDMFLRNFYTYPHYFIGRREREGGKERKKQ